MTIKYEKIKDDIRKKIFDGTFKPGDKIYSEEELKKIYGVSSTTVVKSLNDLVQEGLIIRKQGQGTYVRRNVMHKNMFMSEILDFSKAELKNEQSQVFFFERLGKEFGDYIGDFGKHDDYSLVTQIAYADGTPWKLQNRFLDRHQMTSEFKEGVEKGKSISKLLNLDHNMNNYPSKITIGIEQDLNKDHIIVRKLPKEHIDAIINKNISWLKVTNKISDYKGNFLILQTNYFDTDKYKIMLESPDLK